jgi:predicted RNase H-like HicB family nuclease
MMYEVKLLKSDEEGYAVWCPALPGCWSQGDTEVEALENIKAAITEYLADGEETPLLQAETRTVEVG